jgi:hypothetical protein
MDVEAQRDLAQRLARSQPPEGLACLVPKMAARSYSNGEAIKCSCEWCAAPSRCANSAAMSS